MQEFNSFGAFATHLVKLSASSHEVVSHVTDRSAEEIQKTAQGMIGQYQQAIGPYSKWQDLADSTEAEKARLGYSVDAPLLRTGEMKNSIERTVHGYEAAVGSNDKNMIYHELGTSKIPPRPVLGPAALHSKPRIEKIIGLSVFAWLAGRGWRSPRRLD